MNETKIALILGELRNKKDVSQEIVAEACGISRVTLARYENGSRIPKAENVARLAAYYGVTSDYILGRDQEETAKQSIDNDVEIRFLARGGEHLSPERRKKVEALLASLMDLDDEALDQAGQVIDIYHKR